MRQHMQGSAPNYTDTCLVMGLVNLLWIFFVLWVWKGIAAVLLTALLVNAWINRLEGRRRAR